MRALPFFAASSALAVTSCVAPPREAPPPVVAPTPTPASVPPPRLAADWRDWPLTPGTWTYARAPSGTVASFAAPGQPATVRLTCAPVARQVALAVSNGVGPALTIRTTSTTRSLPAAASSNGTEARLAAADPLLDAMAFSRGKFVVEVGTERLVLPAYAEIGRVIEDCRG